ncbi:MAG: hypothetical protein IPK87_12440 [Planctomycetes bacterium]|nr:hypothetical protein [Planctomycetota bacterium]
MAQPADIQCKVDCPCGWTDVFSKAYSGLQLECPRCGKRHMIPVFSSPSADDEIDMAVMNRLLGTQDKSSATLRVTFKPLFIGAVITAAIVAVVGVPLVVMLADAEKVFVLTATVVGGAFAWPLGILVAWIGQKRHVKQLGEQPVSPQ